MKERTEFKEETKMNQEMQALPQKLLNIEELSQLLGVPKSWIYDRTRMSKTNGFPTIKVGKYCRFRYDEVLDFLKREN